MEGGLSGGIYVYIWLIHVVQQKPTQHSPIFKKLNLINKNTHEDQSAGFDLGHAIDRQIPDYNL